MTALADALAQAQTAAVNALGKQYRGGQMDEDELRIALDSIGQNDPTDTARYVAALDILRATGAEPARQNGTPEEKPSSPAQKQLIDKLCSERGMPTPNGFPRLFAEASAVIDRLKAGKTDPNDYPELYL